MTEMWGLILFPVTGLAIAGLWRGRRMLRDSWPETLAECLAPMMMGLLAFSYQETLFLSTRWVWSACRLAPTIGLFHGFPLYSPVDHGPINGWIYGPVAAIAWVPAALAGSPLPALAVAAAISLAFLLAPLLAASLRFGSDPGSPKFLGFVFGAAGLLLIYPTWYMASVLSVDAIAVGLGVGSCLVLLGSRAPGTRRLLVAALMAVLAAWTKQLEAPLVLAQLGWLGFSRGPRAALRFGACWCAAAGAVGAVILAATHPRDLIFNMWTVPARQELIGGWPAAWGEITAFLGYTAAFSVPCIIIAVLSARGEPDEGPGCTAVEAVALLVCAALVLLPAGVMATIKIAGDRNSIHSAYYLVAAATIALARAWSPAPDFPLARRCAVLLASATVVLLAGRQVARYPGMTMLPPRCLSQVAWTYAREHPGQAYFPWDPLATLMAEGRLYHFEDGVKNRVMAGLPPSDAHIRENMPVDPAAIVYPRADSSRTTLKRYFPDYAFALATEDWLIYRRKDGR